MASGGMPRLTITANLWVVMNDSSMVHGSPCHESFHDLERYSCFIDDLWAETDESWMKVHDSEDDHRCKLMRTSS